MKALLAITLAFSLFACGEEDKTKTDTPTAPEPVTNTAEVTKIEIESNDQMQYNLTELKAKAGAKVSLTLKHTGTGAITSMGHNIVILAAGEEVVAFAQKANAAGAEKDYLHEGANIVAATKVIGGGESTTIEFTAPAAGSYDFICTFPGHFAIMKGKFIVE